VSVAEGGFDNQRHLFFFLVYTFQGAWGLRRSGVWECPQYGTMGGYVSGQVRFPFVAWNERFWLLGGYRFCSVLSTRYLYNGGLEWSFPIYNIRRTDAWI